MSPLSKSRYILDNSVLQPLPVNAPKQLELNN